MRSVIHLFTLTLGLVLTGCTGGIDAQSPRQEPSSPPGSDAPRSGAQALEVSFLDVGQGDATLIRTPEGVTVLIDGGPSGAGPRVVEALRQRQVRKLDWVIGTHPHEDHIGGLIDVLRAVPAVSALDPGYNHGTATQRTYLGLLRDRKVRTIRARSGQTYDLGAHVKLEVLAPEEPLLSGTESDANNNSIVARLVYGSRRFLLTGDMETEERQRLLHNHPANRLQADVLKVAHHGSHNGTDPELLQAVQPQYAVISLGKDNDYGHPHREPMQQLQAARVQILRTDQQGTITFRTDGQSLQLKTECEAPSGPTTPPNADRTGAETDSEPQWLGPVIGNNVSKVYHAPNCNTLPADSRRVQFESAAQAVDAGFRPHAACTSLK